MKRTMRMLTTTSLLFGALVVAHTTAEAADVDGGHAVTLVTGDRVLLGPTGGSRVTPVAGEERDGVGFSIRQNGDHLYVIPSDALPLVASGKVDKRLFDVAMLDEEGYDDRDDVPLIVRGGSGVRSMAGAQDVRSLPSIRGAAIRVAKGDTTFWHAVAGDNTLSGGVEKIWLDARVHLSIDHSVPRIGAPDAWKAGYTGTGVKVAVLDSGVDATHPDLAGRIAERKNFTSEPDTDLIGHGTHVASTVASVDGEYRGVAPDASLLIGKVVTKDGRGDMSALLAAMEWASSERHAKVVNMSLGLHDTPGIDPIEEAVNRLTAQNGTLFVVAAGNAGKNGAQSVASPSTADTALSVGAVDRDGVVADFSGQGPRSGDYAIKPDITAPGVGIVAARSKDGALGAPGESRMAGTGTSMSSPHAAGAAALLFQQHPDWTPAQVKAALMASAKPGAGASAHRQGAGLIDLTRAITQEVLADQPSVGFGQASWPHTDDTPITRTQTYRNLGDTDVTLELAVDGTGPDGEPAGVFTLSSTTLTVPAGGTAGVDITADTRGDLTDGDYTGQVVATGDGTVVRTPIAVSREAESYDVKVSVLDRDGKPATKFQVLLGSYDGRLYFNPSNPDGTVTLRAPRGRYNLAIDIRTGEGDEERADFLVAPWLDVTADRAVTADARTTKPVKPEVEREDAGMVTSTTGFIALFAGGGADRSWVDDEGRHDLRTAQLGPDAPANRFLGAQQAVFANPGADGEFRNSPYVYNLAWFTPGKAYTGARRVQDAKLGKVRTENLPDSAGDVAVKGSLATSTRNPLASMPGTMLLEMRLPFTREELFTTEDVSWTTIFLQNPKGGADDGSQEVLGRTYRAGRHYAERWNGAVFGPSLPNGPGGVRWANQVADARLAFRVPLFGSTPDTVGRSRTDSSNIVVYRDGAKVCAKDNGTICEIDGVPPLGRYRVESSATRSVADTSTKVSVVWEVDHDGTPALPVQVVRFSPALDAANSAPGGGTFAVPVSVQRNPGAKAADVLSLTVEVSYDDGAHWTKVPVVGGKALLNHPAGGRVSLRAKATDTAGNTVDQTIIRAYRLR